MIQTFLATLQQSFMSSRTNQVIKWRKGRRPKQRVKQMRKGILKPYAKAYVSYIKKTAGGSLLTNAGTKWPVRTGFSRDAFHITGKRILTLRGASYAPIVNRWGGNILQHLWIQFGKSKSSNKPLKKEVKKH